MPITLPWAFFTTVQWKKSLSEFLIINENLPEQLVKRGKKANRTIIGQIGGGKNTLNGIIDIALIQSLYHNNEVNPVINNYGMIFVDECHHISAVSFEAVLREAHARYIYGLTATPKRSDGQQPIIFMQCGKIRYTANASDYAKKHRFNHILIPRFTKFRMPITNEKYTITDVYKSITESEYRNKLIAADIIASVKSGRNPIVISERMSHINLLYDLLQNCADNVIILSGKGTSKEKRCQLETLKSIPLSESIVILATGKYVGEGFDEPRLDTLFLSMPISWSGTLAQYAGRLHREYEGKESVIIYDYVDLHIPMLENMYKKRLKGYSQLGYSLNSNNCTDYQTIYSDNSFEKDMYHDITNSQSSVVITGRYFSSYHISMLLKSFENAKLNGSVIHVAVKKSDNTYIDKLLQLLNFHGINYSVKNKITSSFVIIDNKTVWYGSGELFTNFNDECVLRIEDEVLSSELSESVLK